MPPAPGLSAAMLLKLIRTLWVLPSFTLLHSFFPFHLSLLLVDGWGNFDYRNWGLLGYH